MPKVKIESAHDSGRKWKDAIIWEVVAGGQVYDSFTNRFQQLIGQEVEAIITHPSDPKYHPRISLPKEQKAFGGGKSYGDHILTAKTMLMAYAKDIVVATIASKQLPSDRTAKDILLDAYEVMLEKILPKGEAVVTPATSATASPAPQVPLNKKATIWIDHVAQEAKGEGKILYNIYDGKGVKYSTWSRSNASLCMNAVERSVQVGFEYAISSKWGNQIVGEVHLVEGEPPLEGPEGIPF